MRIRRRTVAAAAAFALLLVASPAQGTDFPVTRSDDPVVGTCDPGDCSLREAFMAAEVASGPDSITVPAGAYRLNASTLPTVTQDLTVTGADASSTVIAGSVATGASVGDRAGAIYQTGGTLTLSKLTIHGNTARVDDPSTQSISRGAGGILSIAPAALVLVDTVVSGNTLRADSTSGVGGVFAINLTVTNSKIVGNLTTLNNSSSSADGGILAADISMTGSTVSGNGVGGSPTNATGGAEVGGGTITSSTISGNFVATASVSDGVGGLRSNTAGVANSTISGNTAVSVSGTTLTGGASLGNLEVRNSTIAYNAAPVGGNVRPGAGTPTLVNSIIAGGVFRNCGASIASGGGNVDDQTNCALDPALGDQVKTNPLLGPLQLNGGLTATHALLPGSPAIDAVPAGSACPSPDQRGIGRPVGPRCDAGSFEFVPAVPVNTASPTISGESQAGSTLTCQPGTWTGDPIFTYAWLRNGTPIPGAAGATYALTAADLGTAIQCRVTGGNAGGETVATSAPAVAKGLVNQSRPSIKGSTRVGRRVTCAPGKWTGSPTFGYAWLRNGNKIAKASKKRYKITRRDRGRALQCRVTARKAGTSVVAESKPKVVSR